MKNFKRFAIAFFLTLSVSVSATGVNAIYSASAAPSTTLITTTATGYDSADDVVYKTKTIDGKAVIANWGARGEACGFLSDKATNFYTDSYSFDQMASNAGSTSISAVPNSALYKTLQKMMKDEQSYITSYDATKNKFCCTDCELSDYSNISSFYSGTVLDGAWDSSKWNREHTWPNSKGDLAKSGENDIMMLRPASVSENSSRGNKAYGESTGYYNPNGEGQSLHGDCARIVLYQYVRWGCINTGSSYNPTDIFGTNGVIESLDLLLAWMEEDPVDTWEMGRNDAVQSITGTRNVFVDYPEYAWLLFGRAIPENMTTPSDGKAIAPPISGGDTPTAPDDDEPVTNPTIAQVVAGTVGASYQTKGVVVAKNNKSFLMQDDTGAMLVYLAKTPTVNIGDLVSVSGTTATHGNAVQFANSSTVTKIGTDSVAYPTAKALTAQDCDAYLTASKISPLYVKVTGELTASSPYFNLAIDGAKIVGSLTYPLTADQATLTALSGKTVDVYGYVTGATPSTSTGKTYLNIIFTECKETNGAETPDMPTYTGMSIADTLNCSDGTAVEITGTVIEASAWNTQYNNMSVWITDGTASIYVFGLSAKVALCDKITVQGIMDTYNEERQIGAGATAVILANGNHIYSDVKFDKTNHWKQCVCGAKTEVTAHSFVDGVCSGCKAVEGEAIATEHLLSFGSTDNRTSLSTSQQVWEANGVKLINDKGGSTSNVADYSAPARFYKNSKITIECANMTKIAFNCSSGSYANAFNAALTSIANATVAVNGKVVTVEFESPVDSFVVDNLSGGQVRMDSLTVSTVEINVPVEPDTPVVPDEPVEPDTPVVPDEPVEPDTPADPDEPVEPDTPVVPDEPVEPDTPVVPDEPVEPDTPVVPDEPVEPDTPVVPDEPVEPDTPVVPDEPVEPDTPVVPDEPVEPDTPADPDEPTDTPDEPEVKPENSSDNGGNVVGDFLGGMSCNTPMSSTLMQSVALAAGVVLLMKKRRKH